jgi:diguanylate cyclase (GGDEF)-like protein
MKAGEALEFTSTHDQLTNLPNRTLYNESLKAAINRTKRMRKPMALLYIDIDHFKKVNDTFGHEVGDLLLIDVAQRLSECIRKDDILARLGGDELAVILNDLNDPRDAGNIAAHLLKVISQPFQISNHVINTTLSIGIAIYQEGSDEPGIMNKHADIALYQAKSAGRNNYQYYSPTTPSTLA